MDHLLGDQETAVNGDGGADVAPTDAVAVGLDRRAATRRDSRGQAAVVLKFRVCSVDNSKVAP